MSPTDRNNNNTKCINDLWQRNQHQITRIAALSSAAMPMWFIPNNNNNKNNKNTNTITYTTANITTNNANNRSTLSSTSATAFHCSLSAPLLFSSSTLLLFLLLLVCAATDRWCLQISKQQHQEHQNTLAHISKQKQKINRTTERTPSRRAGDQTGSSTETSIENFD